MTHSWVPARADLLLALVVAVAAVVEVYAPGWSEQPASATLAATALASGLALAWRRIAPLATLVAVLVLGGAQTALLGEPWDTASALVIPMVAVYTVGAHAPPARSVTGYLAAVVGNTLIDVTDEGDADWMFIALIMGAVWVAGLGVRRQRLLVAELAEQSAELRAGHAAREQAVVAAERTRIARELHDVIAHCVTTMVVQAEAGQAWLRRDPDRAGQSFTSVQETGRQALGELHRMLGLLREPPEDSRLPQPTIAQLGRLVEDLRAAGLEVDLQVEGTPVAVSPGVDLSAYRIVQEALTNTLKHADATHATVRIRYRTDHLDISIEDDGTATADAERLGTGHGLLGMRERAQLHGGELLAGHRDSGFHVRTRLPL